MGLKLSCKDAAACLREDYSTIQLAARPAQRRQPNHLNPVISASPWPAWQFVAHWGRPEPWRLLTLRQRQRLLCLAASSGDAPSLDAALAHCGCSLSSEVLISAAAAGCTAACKRLLEEGCEADLNAACAAAEAGHRHLCALLWSKRCWDHTFLDGDGGGDGPDAEDLARVAEAACAGGHAHVLQWLEMHEGLYDDAERWGREYRRQEINEGLAAAAARGGHVPLLQQLLAKLPQPQAGSGQDINWSRLLCDVALGCPLPVLRELAGRWRQLEPPQPRQQQQQQQQLQLGAQRGGGVGRDILLRALGSHTPDWRDKAEWVLSRRSELLAAATTGPGSALRPDGVGGYDWAAAQPDYEQRLRYLVTDKGARSLPAEAAEAAAAAGDVGALRFLLEECGMRLPDTCVSGAAQCGQHAVLEFLRGRGQLPSYSGGGRTLNAGEAPVGVLAAAAVVAARDARHAGYAMSHAYQERDFWSRVFSQAASQGADVTTLRYLHEALGAQWEWLRAAFLASPVSPHATAASTAQRFAGWVARDLIRRRMHALEEEPVGSAGSGHTEAAAAEKAARLERERVAGVMEVRAAAVAGVETSFRDGAQREDKWMADADAQAENEAAMYDDAGYNTDRDDIDDDDLGDPFYPY
eukprot:XP_001692900.1 predicted protein [Chlamydomonas reinhardtii]